MIIACIQTQKSLSVSGSRGAVWRSSALSVYRSTDGFEAGNAFHVSVESLMGLAWVVKKISKFKQDHT